MKQHIEHYKNTFQACSKEYKSNTGYALNFYILGPNKTTILARWVKQLNDRKVAKYSKHQSLIDFPCIAELYMQIVIYTGIETLYSLEVRVLQVQVQVEIL